MSSCIAKKDIAKPVRLALFDLRVTDTVGRSVLKNDLGVEFDFFYFKGWSGKRDLNPRLRPWQGRTLPLSYSRSVERRTTFIKKYASCQENI